TSSRSARSPGVRWSGASPRALARSAVPPPRSSTRTLRPFPRPSTKRPEDSRAMGLDQVGHNFLTGQLEDLVRWARRNSVFPATFGLACCALEMMAAGAAHYDLARYGMEVFRASPRQADLMIVPRLVSQQIAPVLRHLL